MKAYYELVFLNNFIINYFVMWISIDTAKLRFCWWRIAIASAIGGLYVCIILNFQMINSFFIKVLIAFIMVAIMAKYQQLKSYIVAIICFFLYTFLLGGLAQGVLNLGSHNGIIFVNDSFKPILIGGAMLLVYAMCRIVYVHIVVQGRNKKYEQKLTIFVDDKQYKCDAFWDSGNKLYYNNTRPVVMIDKDLALTLFGKERLSKIDEFITVHTVTGDKKLKLVVLDKIQYEDKDRKTVVDVYAAISENSMNNYRVLLNCDM